MPSFFNFNFYFFTADWNIKFYGKLLKAAITGAVSSRKFTKSMIKYNNLIIFI